MPRRLLRFHPLRAGEMSAPLAGAMALETENPAECASGALPDVAGASLFVRLPALGEERFPEFLTQALTLRPSGIVLSRTTGQRQVEQAAARLAVAEAENGLPDGALKIIASIEEAAGVLALSDLTAHARLAGLLCDDSRLAAILGCRHDAPAIAQARGLTVLASSRCGIPSILASGQGEAETAAGEGFAALLVPDE